MNSSAKNGNNPIKIIHIISSLTRGGRERQLAIIVANVDKKKYPAKIVYFNKYNNSYIEEYGLTDFSLQIKSHGKVARLKELHHILKNEKPDIVYTWGNGESVSILLLKPFHKFIFINGSIRHGIRSRKFSHYFRTLVLQFSQCIVANSKAGFKANNLQHGKVLYNGVDEKFLEPLSDSLETKKAILGIPEEIPLLVSVANLVPYKDYYSVLKALKKLKEENHSFYYLILGDGPMRWKVDRMIEKFNLKDNIRIFGNVEDVADYLKICDIFIHSSKGEGCSNAILEAMAAGLPIIATNTGGTAEIVSEKNGFLFEYKDYLALSEILKHLLQNKQKRYELGRESNLIVMEKFTIKRMLANFEIIIRGLFP